MNDRLSQFSTKYGFLTWSRNVWNIISWLTIRRSFLISLLNYERQQRMQLWCFETHEKSWNAWNSRLKVKNLHFHFLEYWLLLMHLLCCFLLNLLFAPLIHYSFPWNYKRKYNNYQKINVILWSEYILCVWSLHISWTTCECFVHKLDPKQQQSTIRIWFRLKLSSRKSTKRKRAKKSISMWKQFQIKND